MAIHEHTLNPACIGDLFIWLARDCLGLHPCNDQQSFGLVSGRMNLTDLWRALLNNTTTFLIWKCKEDGLNCDFNIPIVNLCRQVKKSCMQATTSRQALGIKSSNEANGQTGKNTKTLSIKLLTSEAPKRNLTYSSQHLIDCAAPRAVRLISKSCSYCFLVWYSCDNCICKKCICATMAVHTALQYLWKKYFILVLTVLKVLEAIEIYFVPAQISANQDRFWFRSSAGLSRHTPQSSPLFYIIRIAAKMWKVTIHEKQMWRIGYWLPGIELISSNLQQLILYVWSLNILYISLVLTACSCRVS